MSVELQDLYEPEWISDCCGAPAMLGAYQEPDGIPEGKRATGICSKCKDHASFTRVEDGE